MKIALVSNYLPSGSKIGVGYVVHYFANELVKRGHEVTVYSQTGASTDSLYNVVPVPSGRRFRTFGFAWSLRHFDFAGYDVLNAHGDDWFLWGRKRPRHIHTFHGSCLAEMLSIRGAKEKLRMGMLALCEYNTCLLTRELVGVSHNTRRYIPMIRHVIPNGVDLSQFHPAEMQSPAPSLLFVGTMHGRKRGQMLLDLFQREVRPQVPNAEFWAVCENPVEGEGVRWFGRVPLEELCELYRRAWVFCLPSTYEGFGVPYIEAMASGTPVVASPNVGAREVTQEGRAGILANDIGLGAALVKVLTDADLRHNLRQEGLKRAQDFSWARVCAQYEALYVGDLARLKELAAQ
ncbi:MAG TPA: glycosyltransferase family 4 protein [Chthonomonadaceae bacterium]|nr:glycosyltransferase family 4 protein [Chthonomonadaceae bacterium]